MCLNQDRNGAVPESMAELYSFLEHCQQSHKSRRKKMAVKYVFVTGGVVSGLGKGITAASLGRLLKARGYSVTMQKFDP